MNGKGHNLVSVRAEVTSLQRGAPIQQKRACSCREEHPNPCCKYDLPTRTEQAGQYLLPILISRNPSSSGWLGKLGNAISMVWEKGSEAGATWMNPLAQATRKNHTRGPGLCAMSGKAPSKPTEEDMEAVATPVVAATPSLQPGDQKSTQAKAERIFQSLAKAPQTKWPPVPENPH